VCEDLSHIRTLAHSLISVFPQILQDIVPDRDDVARLQATTCRKRGRFTASTRGEWSSRMLEYCWVLPPFYSLDTVHLITFHIGITRSVAELLLYAR
jgi:hypothetical protein